MCANRFGSRLGFLACLAVVVAAPLGCVSHDYVGQTFAPTENVDVYFDESAVPPGLIVIGHDRAVASDDVDTQTIVTDMCKKAQKVGADALLIVGVDTVDSGVSTSTTGSAMRNTSYYVDKRGNLRARSGPSYTYWNENSSTTVLRDRVVTAKFYRRERAAEPATAQPTSP